MPHGFLRDEEGGGAAAGGELDGGVHLGLEERVAVVDFDADGDGAGFGVELVLDLGDAAVEGTVWIGLDGDGGGHAGA